MTPSNQATENAPNQTKEEQLKQLAKQHLQALHDDDGHFTGVYMSPEFWEVFGARAEKLILNCLEQFIPHPLVPNEPLEDWQTFKDYWDFKYPFTAAVECSECNTKTDNWEEDPAHPFQLLNASLSGLLLFKCKTCNSRISKKHFKDHIAVEVRPNKS